MDYSTKGAVQQVAVDLRQRQGAMDWQARIDDLIAGEGLTQDTFTPYGVGRVFGLIRSAIQKTAKKVKAVIAVKEKIILVAHDLHQTKTPFAKGHELGHSALPWHREILYVCDEHDLSPNTRDQMEFEANTFSAEVMLPSPLLDTVYGLYETSMDTPLLLHQWTGASIEMCALRYVERHPDECALLTLDELRDTEGAPQLKLSRKCLSPRGARSKLGSLTRGQTFASNHSLYVNSRVSSITTRAGLVVDEQRYSVSLFNNTYRVLALVHR